MNIKNKSYIVAGLFVLGLFSACSKDNYQVPNASLYGEIIDEQTKELVPQQTINGGQLQLFQTDISDKATSINSVLQSNGDYRNDMLFDGNYKIVLNGPFFYDDTLSVKINGETKQDILVRAYLHVKSDVVEVTANSAKVKVHVLNGLNNDQKIARIAAVMGTTNSLDINFFSLRELTDTESIDNEQLLNAEHTYEFKDLKPNTTYYVRAAARTINTGNYYNYSPMIEIKTLDN